MKRGQVTIFLVIGVLLLATAAGIFFLTQEKTEIYSETSYDPATVQFFIEACLRDSTDKIARAVAIQGGSFTPQDTYLFSYPTQYEEAPQSFINTKLVDLGDIYDALPSYPKPLFNIPLTYGLIDDEITFPTLGQVELEIAKGVEEILPACLQDLQVFDERAKITILSEPKVTVQIADQIDASLDYIVDVDGTRMEIFHISTPLNYKFGYLKLQKYLENHNYEIDLTSSFDIIILEPGAYAIIYTNNGFSIATAIKSTNKPPIFLIEKSYTLKQFEPFTLELETISDDLFSFSDDSILFDVSDMGLIDYTPLIYGTFEVTITMTDEVGQEDIQTTTIIIEANDE